MKRIVLATNNRYKVKEVGFILSELGIQVLTPNDLRISFNAEETGSTFAENAFIKARELFRLTKLPSIADDSGICVSALGGEPGVYSARFGGPGLKDEDRALFLLEKMKENSDRRAHYTCVITYVDETSEQSFEGRCEGTISEEYDRIGMYGFGYDPIFIYPPFQKPFSQVPEAEKNSVSHRKKALEQFLKFLKTKS
ncbi:RdgB/HAM1 family non-canonical purine NTP pyrophosphatase [Leptospira borgpetersenii serovar Hardjo-bovis]|uniref:dITP/XTP pyrophosphatase n=1 Tax=Leptospira borgpetersenii serovar Hardjo-bovis str. Sponselee TaxID=1303729 RepID=M6C0A4_LEPBO|nr:RdgB/HAM1 family non-canonical purine NTP pyrophosphatase [Leptospira borgpetersenii]ABJ77810.1 Xanthosine triphosphate pyrophosphatase [Leptospira borgpetersenii serovar Hardjo-bovis str. L550]AMX57034.1 NTP phosphatase [Leptospira borgpetersenii serovar Hardjo]AMX60265.1 NTP phosphatase [Leptospira borgpetersenii serovar Hardjo]AMX63512.1 NTP phosphatase [Leptospira borgpetersenii serovar Hardjo]AMX66751.1 NTP phosphatase [Leptospira borgpetersenii serovar Hardjo]